MNLLELLATGRSLHGKRVFQGLTVSIENRAGSVRKGIDPATGKPWSTTMKWPYGYLVRTKGVDGDHVDVFIGPNENATHAYVIHQNNPTTGRFDEDKVVLGVDSADAAKDLYFEHYDEPEKYFGSIEAIPMREFKEKVLATKDNPKKIAAMALRFGGPGSGCHGENCGRPSEAVSHMLDSFRGKLRPEIADKLHYVVKEDMGEVGIGQVAAKYTTKDKTVHIPTIGPTMSDAIVRRKLAHELGHYLAHEHLALLDPTKLQGTDKVLVQDMLNEYAKEKAKWKGNEAASFDDSDNVLKGYSLRNQHEWFAEAARYFLSHEIYHKELQRGAPATFKLLQLKFGNQ